MLYVSCNAETASMSHFGSVSPSLCSASHVGKRFHFRYTRSNASETNLWTVMARYTMMPVNHTIECFQPASIMFMKFTVTRKRPILRTTTLALHDVSK
jgi:hypothetical protein